MFDLSFTELMVIGVVALIIIGPERLPAVARTLGHLIGRMQRYVHDVKSDIQREMELDELNKLRRSVEESAREIEQSVNRELDQAQSSLRELETGLTPGSEPVNPLLDATPPTVAEAPREASEPAAAAPGKPKPG